MFIWFWKISLRRQQRIPAVEFAAADIAAFAAFAAAAAAVAAAVAVVAAVAVAADAAAASRSVQDGESGIDLIAVEADVGKLTSEDTVVIGSSTKGASRTQTHCSELFLFLL